MQINHVKQSRLEHTKEHNIVIRRKKDCDLYNIDKLLHF